MCVQIRRRQWQHARQTKLSLSLRVWPSHHYTQLHSLTRTHTHTHTVAHTRAGKQQTRICEYSSATAKYVNARVQREIQSSRSFSSFLTKLRDEHLDRPKQNERGPTNERRFNSSSAGTHCAPHKSGQMC